MARSWFATSSFHLRERALSKFNKNVRYINHYRLVSELGYGSSGVVYLAVEKHTHHQYAIKELSKSKLRRQQQSELLRLASPRARKAAAVVACATTDYPSPHNDDDLQESLSQENNKRRRLDSQDMPLREIELMRDLKHPNIIELIEVIEDADSVYLVLELADKRVIQQEQQSRLRPEVCRSYFAQLVDAVDYLHSEHHIVHRDIKPDNLLLSHDGASIKLADFGSAMSATQLKDPLTSSPSLSARTPAFTPPEHVLNKDHTRYDYPADVWAMGITLFCMCTGELPFTGPNFIDLYHNIRQGSPVYPDGMDPDLRSLLECMLDKDPETRITLAEIKSHAWLTSAS
ncbi:kinase-like domain-containing protein [Syncephalastrum racemosum]|uniref:Kinase-like domain-containing protein n=1 Tax=Syncephalastrum racemosum TaxID=13706 RepID=A0A1X2HIQ0_SYNRA|nr:kinase-like domain-containing protein [Syncephalastrum racemosum]